MRAIMIAVSAVVVAAPALAQDPPTLNARIDALFAAYAEGARPGYVIGVVRDGALLHAGGYGAADLETGAPLTPDTPMNLASLSKQFTGAAVAIEMEKGAIALDDPMREHWPGWPAFADDVTVAHLVYMTSGLPEYYTRPSPRGGWSSENRFTVDDAIAAVFGAGALEFRPGTRWAYSNINYQLLAETAARKNGVAFADHMTAAVFAPLGMDDTWVDAPIRLDRADRAVAYVWDDHAETGWRAAPRQSPHYGGSGVFSTVRDLARWDRALYRDKALGPEASDWMLARRAFDHDKTNDAFGLVHGRYQGMATIWYEGGDYGVSSYMVRIPSRDETVICLANFANAGCVGKARAVIDLLIAFGDG